jgi:N-acetylmuramoyl-L-alanine amidase
MKLNRRRFTTLLLLTAADIARGASIIAVRVWPAADYTRVTIESDTALVTKHVFVADPPRLAVDIEGIDLSPALKELVSKVKSDDPFISKVRAGQNAPGVVRLVLDLKQAAVPQVFNLKPVAAYQHRLVFDLYPAVAIDPLDTLIASLKESPSAKAPPPSVPTGTPVPATTPASDPLGDLLLKLPHSLPKTTPQAPPAAAPKPPQAATPVLPLGMAQPTSKRFIIVALDAGHGGEDPGAIGPAGTREKDIVLQMALMLREKMNQEVVGGNPMRAFLTRDGDYFVPLNQRVQKAQRVRADLFVSIHADAFFTPTAKGASVFALSERAATSSAAKWIADKENKADLVGGLNIAAKDKTVARALLDMSTTAQIKDSLNVGSAVLGEIGGMAKLHKKHVEQANFAVLKAPDIPSLLIETAFISHPEEEQKLKDPAYQEQLTSAILRGLKRYFAKHPPLARDRNV